MGMIHFMGEKRSRRDPTASASTVLDAWIGALKFSLNFKPKKPGINVVLQNSKTAVTAWCRRNPNEFLYLLKTLYCVNCKPNLPCHVTSPPDDWSSLSSVSQKEAEIDHHGEQTGIRRVWREMSWQERNHSPRIGFSPYSPHRQNWTPSQTQWKGQRGVGARGAEIEVFCMTVCTKRNDDHQLSSHTYQYKPRQPVQRPPCSNFPSKHLIPPEKPPNCNLLQQEPGRLQRTSNALQVRNSAWACIAAITKLLLLLMPAKGRWRCPNLRDR